MPTHAMVAQGIPPYSVPPGFDLGGWVNRQNAMQTPPPPPAAVADPEKDKKIEELSKMLEAHKAEKEAAQKAIEDEKAALKKAAEDAKAKAEAEAKAAEELAKHKAKAEQDARDKVEAEVRAKAMADAAKAEAEAKAAEELAKHKAKAEQDARDKVEAEVKAKATAEAAKAEADARAAKDLADYKIRLELAAKEKAEADIKAAKAAEEAKAEAAKKAADEMALFRAKAAIEAKEMAEAAVKAKADADAAAAAEAAAKAKAEGDAKKLVELEAKIAEGQKNLDALKAGQTDKKKPIKFKDALNRKFSFPYEICATWEGMESLIRQAFDHVDVLGPLVAQRQYDLVGPNGEIILPQIWETMIEPDLAIAMHMWPLPEPPKRPEQHVPIPSDMRRPSKHGARVSAPNGGKPPPPPPAPKGTFREGAGNPNIAVVPDKKKAKAGGAISWMAGGSGGKSKPGKGKIKKRMPISLSWGI